MRLIKFLYKPLEAFVFCAAFVEFKTKNRMFSFRFMKLRHQFGYAFFLRRLLVFCQQETLAENLCRAMLVNQFVNSIQYAHRFYAPSPNVGLHGSAVADTVEGVVRNVFNEVNDV